MRPLEPRCDSQLISGGPSAAVENVLLHQGEEALHRRVVTSRADSAYRPDDTVTGQRSSEFPRPKLAAFSWSSQLHP